MNHDRVRKLVIKENIRKLFRISRGYPFTILLLIILVLGIYGSVLAASVLYPSHGLVLDGEYPSFMYGGGSCYNGGCIAWDVGINGSTNLQWAGTQLHFSTYCPSNTGGSWLMGADTTTDGGANQHFECGQGGSANFNIYASPGIHTTHFQAFQQETVQNGQSYNIIFSGFQAFGAYDTTPPTDPTFNNESHGLASGIATRTVTTPNFTWNASSDGETGIDHYNVYWGPSASGTSITTTTAGTSYAPVSPVDGTYYLRIQAVNGVSLTSNWVTMFSYQLDTTPPTVVGACTEDHSLVNDSWQNTVNIPAYTWEKPSVDTTAYLVYWGNSASGTTATQITTESYAPTAPVAEGTDYIRLASQDTLGNTSAWTTCFTYKYDVTPPVNFGLATDSAGSTNNGWQRTVTNPNFSLAIPTDLLSGWSKTRFYWGPLTTGIDNTASWLATNPTTISQIVANPGIYYLRAQSQDVAGNASSWQTVYTFKYENVLPIASATINPPAGTWTNANVVASVTGTDADSGIAHIYCKLSGEASYTDGGLGPCTRIVTANDVVSYYSQDAAGNDSTVATITVTNIDKIVPGTIPTITDTQGAITGQCKVTSSPPTFSWTAPVVGAGESPIAKYLYYFGPLSTGTDITAVTGTSLTPSGGLDADNHYYFRVAVVDTANNQGPWSDAFDWCYQKPPVQQAIDNVIQFIIPPIPTVIPTPTMVPTIEQPAKSQPSTPASEPAVITTPVPIPTAIPTAVLNKEPSIPSTPLSSNNFDFGDAVGKAAPVAATSGLSLLGALLLVNFLGRLDQKAMEWKNLSKIRERRLAFYEQNNDENEE